MVSPFQITVSRPFTKRVAFREGLQKFWDISGGKMHLRNLVWAMARTPCWHCRTDALKVLVETGLLRQWTWVSVVVDAAWRHCCVSHSETTVGPWMTWGQGKYWRPLTWTAEKIKGWKRNGSNTKIYYIKYEIAPLRTLRQDCFLLAGLDNKIPSYQVCFNTGSQNSIEEKSIPRKQ